ncbi:MAG: NfeD family protein [Chitinophagaceae bacterium]|nr:NfeD family protein [Chitinophagaceae bacterium]MCW5903961.1 NfeD family protein [Chitinophagaceae bacterium]
MEIFNHLESTLKIFWIIAIIASVIFIIQGILTFMGTDVSDGTSADFNGDLIDGDTPFQLFSFRNLINFLLGFGWAGVTLYHTISNKTLLAFIAFIIGIIFLVSFFLIIKQIQRLAEDNSFSIEKALYKTGQVYLTIPKNKEGKGKVQVSVNGSVHELDAITENDTLSSGQMIRVTAIIDNNLLLVEKL